MSEVLKLENIARSFPQAGAPIEVLNNVNLTLTEGEMVALVGPSGSGKTTLLQIAGLLEAPTNGKVLIAEKSTAKLTDQQQTALRRQYIGFVYQHHHLLPEFSALENIILPQLIAGVPKKEAYKKATSLLEQVQLSDRATHRPARLSGGERQRVAIARALANDPALLIADEPTGNLDYHIVDDIFDLLLTLVRTTKTAILIATHNMSLAHRMDRVLELRNGEIYTHLASSASSS